MVPKKQVTRMYSSLYSSNQIKTKSSNGQQMKDYERLYKDFMKSKRSESNTTGFDEPKNPNFGHSTVINSNGIT